MAMIASNEGSSSLQKGKTLHILCMVSASQSAENCALL